MKYFNYRVITTLTLLFLSHTAFCMQRPSEWEIQDQTFDTIQRHQQPKTPRTYYVWQQHTQTSALIPPHREVYVTPSANLTSHPLAHFLPSRVEYAKQLEERNNALIEENSALTQQVKRNDNAIRSSLWEKIEELSTVKKKINRKKKNTQYHVKKRNIELQKAKGNQRTAAFKLYTAYKINQMIRSEHSQKGKTKRIN